jgi:hypothetical protein
MAWRERLSCCALACLAVWASACGGGPCANAEDLDVPLSDFPCASTEDGVWQSHPFPPIEDEACLWFEFNGCSTYRFENPLGRAPTTVIGYTSFDPDGDFATVGSGNSFIVEAATLSEITIRNAQSQLFYLRLVLE